MGFAIPTWVDHFPDNFMWSNATLVTKGMLKIFTAAEGGAEHCQVDNRQVGVDYIADWLAPLFGHA